MTDDDECRLGTHSCTPAEECRNLPGSYRCIPKVCPEGYKLDVETGQCNPVTCPRGYRPDNEGNCIGLPCIFPALIQCDTFNKPLFYFCSDEFDSVMLMIKTS